MPRRRNHADEGLFQALAPEKATSPAAILYAPGLSGRATAPPPGAARRSSQSTGALIDSIDRRWKFTSGALSWHPDERRSGRGTGKRKVSGRRFEQVAFAGLEADQRNILCVRHTHAGHHELHFLIPRLELSSGRIQRLPSRLAKDF